MREGSTGPSIRENIIKAFDDNTLYQKKEKKNTRGKVVELKSVGLLHDLGKIEIDLETSAMADTKRSQSFKELERSDSS